MAMNPRGMIVLSGAIVAMVGVAIGAWSAFDAAKTAKADPRFVANGEVIAESMRVETALTDASERVGFRVRVPDSVPEHLVLRAIRTDVGGIQVDQNGQQQDLTWIRAAFLNYSDGKGESIEVVQSPPERSTKLPAAVGAKTVNVNDTATVVMVAKSDDSVTVTWDSPQSTYSATYRFPPESVSSVHAEEILLSLLDSMG